MLRCVAARNPHVRSSRATNSLPPPRGRPCAQVAKRVAHRECATLGWGPALTPPGALEEARPPPHQGEGWSSGRRAASQSFTLQGRLSPAGSRNKISCAGRRRGEMVPWLVLIGVLLVPSAGFLLWSW